jgi:hypothetical protein
MKRAVPGGPSAGDAGAPAHPGFPYGMPGPGPYMPPGMFAPPGYGGHAAYAHMYGYPPPPPPPPPVATSTPAHGARESRSNSPAHQTPRRKRSFDDVRSSSPLLDDGLTIDEFCGQYKLTEPEIVKGLKTIQFAPGMDISRISDAKWEKHGIEAGGVLQIERANKKYKKDVKNNVAR